MRLRKVAAMVGVAAAMTLPAAPALAAEDDCTLGGGQGSAAGEVEGECEVLDEVLERPDQAAPAVEETLPVTGVGSLGLLAAAGGTIVVGGGAVAIGRRRKA